MRVLCLHGRGSNNEIFKLQTAGFRAQLPEYDFDFVQGTVEHTEGNWSLYTTSVSDQPLYTYYAPLSPTSILETEDSLLGLIRDEGPFDGVMAYSGGAALAAQLIIRDGMQRRRANEDHRHEVGDAIFKWAVLINGVTPLRVFRLDDEEVDVQEGEVTDVETVLREEGADFILRGSALREKSASTVEAIEQKKSELLHGLTGGVLGDGTPFLSDGTHGIVRFRRVLGDHPLVDIPTLHVRSLVETDAHNGVELSKLCLEERKREYYHAYGHDFPRGRGEILEIARLIRDVAENA